MKKVSLILCALILSSITISQTNVYLKINHKLGTNSFAHNSQITNNIGSKFKFTRLQYYISKISITHDGGTVTNVPGKVLLVNAANVLNDSLGKFNITTIEKVTLAIGVNSALNHLDPSTYSASHPLAPKSPSMHWGWTSGYRFVALEGKSGTTTLNQQCELHCLNDVNYFYFTITTAGTTSGGDKVIELTADYTQAIKNINVTPGVIAHGLNGMDKTVLDNFRDYVFTSTPEGNISVGIKENTKSKTSLTIFPNPVNSKTEVSFTVNSEEKNMTLQVMDITGKLILNKKLESKSLKLNTLKKGVYLVTLRNEKGVLRTEKLVVTQ